MSESSVKRRPRKRKLPDGLWQRGGIYYARFRKHGRLIRRRLSSDFDVACEALNSLRARADRGDFNLVDNDYKWDDLKTEFLRWARQSVRGADVYERDLAHIEKYCKVQSIRQIDQAYVVGFREWRLSQSIWAIAGKATKAKARNVSPRTVNREVGTLTNMLNKAVAWGKIGSNPIASLQALRHDEPRKTRRALSLAEVEALFANAPAVLLPVLRMFATTGIRRAELVNLRFSDVDFEGRSITIRAVVAKSGKAREIPLDDATHAMLVELRDKAAARQPIDNRGSAKRFSSEHVFVNGANSPWRNNLLREFYRVCGKAGIEGAGDGGSVDLHSLRVTFTTLALEHGASPKAVQAILGHSTLAMTMGVYAKATEKAKREAVSALPFAKASTPAHVISIDAARTERSTVVSESPQIHTA